MNAGKVLATGSPAELKAQTGAATVEEAFIACCRKSSAPATTRSKYRRAASPTPSR